MNPQMDVLYLKDLGHVLAAFTRASEPDQIETSAALFVGDGLHLRGLEKLEAEDFLIPATQIEMLRTNLDTLPLRTPRNYCVQSGNPPLLEFTQSFTAAPTPTAVTLTAVMPATFAAGTKVQVLIEGASLGSPLVLTPPPTSASAPTIPIPVPTLASGTYYALVFVPLYPIMAASFTV
jgi:hypothetical protein